jgi:hypothetical protein
MFCDNTLVLLDTLEVFDLGFCNLLLGTSFASLCWQDVFVHLLARESHIGAKEE